LDKNLARSSDRAPRLYSLGDIMNFKTNSAYIIGNGHKYCEDFACHDILKDKNGKEIALAIVADGCSSSLQNNGVRNPINVDLGSRIATVVARNLLKKMLKEEEITEDFKFSNIYNIFIYYLNFELWRVIRSLEVKVDVLDTTLMICLCFPNGKCVFIAWGDGVMIRNSEGIGTFYRKISYTSNAPLYVSYFLDPKKKDAYIKEFGTERIQEENVFFSNEKDFPSEQKIDYEFQPVFIETDINIEDKEILIMSDGSSSFIDINGEQISTLDFLKWFSQNKTDGIGFVERKINLLNRWKKKNDIKNMDDFAVAGILISN